MNRFRDPTEFEERQQELIYQASKELYSKLHRVPTDDEILNYVDSVEDAMVEAYLGDLNEKD